MLNTLENLIKLARERKKNPIKGSYTNQLLSDKSLSKAKVLEEIDELIEAIEENTNKTHEAADVFYHLLMYLEANDCLLYTSPSPRDRTRSRMPSSA